MSKAVLLELVAGCRFLVSQLIIMPLPGSRSGHTIVSDDFAFLWDGDNETHFSRHSPLLVQSVSPSPVVFCAIHTWAIPIYEIFNMMVVAQQTQEILTHNRMQLARSRKDLAF